MFDRNAHITRISPERSAARMLHERTLTFAERVAYQRRDRRRLLASPHLA